MRVDRPHHGRRRNSLQVRPEVVEDYATLIGNGVEFPPAVVYQDGDDKLWLAAGRHRAEAYARAGEVRMPCLIRRGTRWDAIRFGIEDNLKQGERLSRDDRRFNVKRVLQEKPGMTDRAVAELCQVSPTTVAKYRPPVQSGQVTQRQGRDGKTYNTSNLGRKPTAVPASASPGDKLSGGAPAVPAVSEPAECVAGGDGATVVDPAEAVGQVPSSAPAEPGVDAAESLVGKAAEPSLQGDEILDGLPCRERPDEKVLERAFLEVTRNLGKLKGEFDRLADLVPGPCYQAVIGLLDKVGDELVRWRDEEIEQPTPA